MKYFTVGPTELFPVTKKFIAEAIEYDVLSISHRSNIFKDFYNTAEDGLRKLLNIPDSHLIFFYSSATEIMERIIENCVLKTSYHIINGAFSERFYEIANELNKETYLIKIDWGRGFYGKDIKGLDKAEVICITQNETSTGVFIPLEEIYKIKEKYPDKIIAIDIVSSAPYIEIDFSKIDIAFFSVQKGFGLPAGLGVCILSRNCIDKAELIKNQGVSIGSYHNFLNVYNKSLDKQTVETPNVFCIYLLSRVVNYLIQERLDNITRRVKSNARKIYEFLDQSEYFKPFVKEDYFKSYTTIVIECKIKSNVVLDYLYKNGLVLSNGYGKFEGKHIRIGNFGMHDNSDVNNLLDLLKNFEENSLKS